MGETSREITDALFIVRRMTTDDVDAAAAIDKKCFGKRDAWRRSYFLAAMKNLRNVYFVAEADGQVVACAGAELRKDSAEIQTVAVDPDYHGLGIGTKLFGELIAAIEERGIPSIYLEVRIGNTPAIEFYDKFGFRAVAELENYYRNGDGFLMMRDLQCDSNSEQ